MTILVRAEFRAHAGRAGAFRELAAALADAAAAEPGTLRYAWFAGADAESFVVIEEYTDPAAALAHNAACAELLGRVGAVATLTTAALHGDLDDALIAWADRHPQATTHPPLAGI